MTIGEHADTDPCDKADTSRHSSLAASQRNNFGNLARFVAPQILTSLRAVLGVFVIFLPVRYGIEIAAKVWLFGLATDALDGVCARKLGVASSFGELFDYFTDYIYYVVAPSAISFFLLGADLDLRGIFLLSMPYLFGAIRYARKTGLSETEIPGIPASPGMATVVYGLFVIALVFLHHEGILDSKTLTPLVLVATPLLSVLMVIRTRYPKLGVYAWILLPILTGLVIMPFYQTPILAEVMLGIVLAYIFIGPLLVKQRPERSVNPKGARTP